MVVSAVMVLVTAVITRNIELTERIIEADRRLAVLEDQVEEMREQWER